MDKVLMEYDYILMLLIKFLNSMNIEDLFKKDLIKKCFAKLFKKNSFEVLTIIMRYKFYDSYVTQRATV